MLQTEGKTEEDAGDGRDAAARCVSSLLKDRNIVLVGMMGAGKTSVGRRLATALDLPFLDADQEIETAANLTIPEIFEIYGEAQFREGERKVIRRLLGSGPAVLATGGGAFEDPQTREAIAERGISVWLKADLAVLFERVRRKSSRPLLNRPNPKAALAELLARREPTYALADLTVHSRDTPHATVVRDIVAALKLRLEQGEEP
ncbi:shikimate kinase [Afifella sp. IM 167]|uniref:shikimate kinase n=1 Tax=Afifella sp. IM 167 TaxID=2033586 RepID=UPI001CCDC301|nr:shikimate kinase [Afifella sp. IM 167]MBZ8133005.1 shikimate kinase [Afifella sp. IM 167]